MRVEVTAEERGVLEQGLGRGRVSVWVRVRVRVWVRVWVRARVRVRVRARVRVRVSTAPMLSLALRGTETMLTAPPLAAVAPTVARKCAK